MEIFTDPQGYRKWYELHEKIYESEKNLVAKFTPKDCLDIGAGPGIFHEVFEGNTISLDFSIFMLKEIKRDEDKVLAEAHYLPFRDNAVRCAFVSVTICFLENIEDFYKEVHRVIKDRVITCFIPRDSSWGEYYYALGLKGHKYYSKANFIRKQELYEELNKFFKISRIMSTLFISPNEEERVEDVRNDDSGSFVCVEALKSKSF